VRNASKGYTPTIVTPSKSRSMYMVLADAAGTLQAYALQLDEAGLLTSQSSNASSAQATAFATQLAHAPSARCAPPYAIALGAVSGCNDDDITDDNDDDVRGGVDVIGSSAAFGAAALVSGKLAPLVDTRNDDNDTDDDDAVPADGSEVALQLHRRHRAAGTCVAARGRYVATGSLDTYT
jgi:hypothetical protein